jgi:hypothetical protein
MVHKQLLRMVVELEAGQLSEVVPLFRMKGLAFDRIDNRVNIGEITRSRRATAGMSVLTLRAIALLALASAAVAKA